MDAVVPVDHGELDGEAPRCRTCWHRRIHHFRLTVHGSSSRAKRTEIPTLCAYWVDDEGTRCNCAHYEPVAWRMVT